MESKTDYRRVPITMPREMYTYMLKLGTKSQESGGKKLQITWIVRCAIRVLKALPLDVTGVMSEEELQSRIEEACKRHK
jgi:hypothetical protein